MATDNYINELEEHTGLVSQLPSLAKLSLKEFNLITTLIETGNKRAAARKAGYSSDAFVSVLMKKPYLQQAYSDLLAIKKAERLQVLEQVINSLVDDAFYDVAEAFDENGQALPLEQMSAYIRQRITGYKQGRFGVEISFVDRQKAKDSLLALLGAGQNNQGLTVTMNFTAQAEEQAKEDGLQVGQITLYGLGNAGAEDRG